MFIQIIFVFVSIIGILIDFTPFLYIGGVGCLIISITGSGNLLRKTKYKLLSELFMAASILLGLKISVMTHRTWQEGLFYSIVIYSSINSLIVLISYLRGKKIMRDMNLTYDPLYPPINQHYDHFFNYDDIQDTINQLQELENKNNESRDYEKKIDQLRNYNGNDLVEIYSRRDEFDKELQILNNIIDNYDKEKFSVIKENNYEIHHFDNGNLKYKCSIDKDNKKIGKAISYYPSGKIYSEVEYNNDLTNGLVTYYFENGNKMQESMQVDGMLHGEATLYRKGGKILAKSYYNHGAKISETKINTE